MATGQEVHIIAIINPKPGKLEILKERLQDMAESVHSKEDYTNRYIMTEQLGEANPKIIMIETYKDKAGADAHTQTEHFKGLFKALEEEDVVAEPPFIAQTVSKAGFDLDRKLIK